MIITERDFAIARQCSAETKAKSRPACGTYRKDSTLYTLADGSQHTLAQLARRARFKTDPSNVKRRLAAGMTPDEAIRYRGVAEWKRSKAKATA